MKNLINDIKQFFTPLLITLFIFCTAVLTTYYFSLIKTANQKHMVYYHAVLNIKFEAIEAHLLIEHSLTTEKTIKFENISSHLDELVGYINVMLKGGLFQNTLYIPIENEELRDELLYLKSITVKFKNDSFKSINKGETSLLKLFANQQHNENIKRILGLTEKLELKLDLIMKNEMSKLKNLQILLSLSLFIFGLIIIIIIIKYEYKNRENLHNIKSINKSLKESKEKYQTILENSPIGICVVDDAYKVTNVNQKLAKMMGYSEMELLNLCLLDIFDKSSREQVKNNYKRRQAGEKVEQGYEAYIKCKDASIKNIQIYSVVIKDQNGKNITISQWVDVTKQKESFRKVKELSKQLINSQEMERSHISRDLHDDIGQELTALKLTLLSVNDKEKFEQQKLIIQECIAKTEHINNKIRNISHILRPAILDDLGLVAAIRSLLNKTLVVQNLIIDFHEELSGIKFSKETEITCYRIVQEAITNILRYAQTTTVKLKLFIDSEKLHIIIEDRGLGFDVLNAKKNVTSRKSLGLFNMENRALLIDGTFEIKSTVGKGTQIYAVLPC